MSMDKSLMNSLGLDEKLAKLNIREACPKVNFAAFSSCCSIIRALTSVRHSQCILTERIQGTY